MSLNFCPVIPLSLRNVFCPADFAGSDSVIAAVSGGGDSLALLLLLQMSLARLDQPPRLIAITIDHALRPQSAEEARFVAAFCTTRGITHETFVWAGEKPKTGLAQKARIARYQLLFQAAQKYKAGVIFTGHTLDDQAETYVMRAQRFDKMPHNNFVRGLAAMSRLSRFFSHLKLIRPLLGIRRACLRQFLQQNSIRWIEDPSNEDQNFERVRIRKSLNEVAIANAIQATQQASASRHHYNDKAMSLLHAMRPQRLGECYVFEYVADKVVQTDVLWQLIADLATLVGGGAYLRSPPSALRTFLIETLIETGQQKRVTRLSWGGSILERRQSYLLMWREQRNLARQILAPQTSFIWDGRYQITNLGEEVIHIRPPTRQEILPLIEGIYQTMPIKLTMAAQMSTPVFSSSCGVELPVLQGFFNAHTSCTLNRILLPYDWLICEDDFALVHSLQRLFSCMIGTLR